MKVLIEWSIPRETIVQVLTDFGEGDLAEYQAGWNEGMVTLGRWHDPATGRALAVVETDDLSAVTQFVMSWNGLAQPKISVVYDDAETHALAQTYVQSKTD